MWNRARMSPTDFSDVSAATYTYLMNGTTPAGNWTGMARAGERVRLRFIDAGAATFFASALLLKSPEITDAMGAIRRRLTRGSSSA